MSRSHIPLQATGNEAGEVVSPLEPNEYPLHDIEPNRESSRTSEATTHTEVVDANVNPSRPPTPPPGYEPESIKSYPIKIGKWHLRRRNRPFLLLFIYFPLLVIPWVLTCILNYQPLRWTTYFDHSAGLSPRVLENVKTTMVAIRILNSIVALITISVISAVIAYAAVVFTQKSRNGKELNLAQTFSLANRDWADIRALLHACKLCPGHVEKGKRGPSSWFLWIGFALLLIGATQHPLQQLLVSTEALQVATCLDSPERYLASAGCGYSRGKVWERVGYDPRPSILQLVPRNLIVQDITKNLIMVSDDTLQANLWVEDYERKNAYDSLGPDSGNVAPDWYMDIHRGGVFTASVPAGTTTGVLREHTMRMNSVVECSIINKDKFPAICPGSNPFTTSFSSSILPNFNASKDPSVDVRICSPGNQTQNPWVPFRDRQVITEELFIDASLSKFFDSGNFTVRCDAETTRGYFELGNTHNNNTPGPVLDFWPDDDDINTNFDDNYPGASWNMTRWDTNATSGQVYGIQPNFQNPRDTTFSTDRTNAPETPGPLQTTVIALFGNTSFIANLFQPSAINTTATQTAALSAICRMDTIPYVRLPSSYQRSSSQPLSSCQSFTKLLDTNPSGIESYISQLAGDFMQNFASNASARQALGMGMFFANRATLTHAASVGKGRWGRTLRTSPGTTVYKPDMTFRSMIIISILIGMQVIGLFFLAIYAYKTPTWTSTLDARALAAIGAGMVEVLPKERLGAREWMKVDLRQVNGVLGDGPAGERVAFSERIKARARRVRGSQPPLQRPR